MLKSFVVLLLLATLAAADFVYDDNEDFDPFLDIPFKPMRSSADRIRSHGYPAESHFVETEDGYVLNIFRIPYSPKLGNQNAKKNVVLLQHGLLSCSDCFLLNGPDNALAYNFADAGFDVWLGNSRGNIYSRNNTKISQRHPKFWSYSWHEIGIYDQPAVIDYILAKTGETKLHYVGHSQGTTVFFVMASLLPEYNEKIKTAHMLAPPIFMGNVTDGLIVALAPYVGTPGKGSRILENQQFLPENPFVQNFLHTACGDTPMLPDFCLTLFLLWSGNDQPNLNMTLLPQLAETHPAGISTNQGIHFIQEKVSNEFRQYDHGLRGNMKRYGQPEPPKYPIEKITSDMYIYYGLADGSANHLDAQRLLDLVPKIKHFHEVPLATFGHTDFIFALDVKELINDQVIDFSLKYEEEKLN